MGAARIGAGGGGSIGLLSANGGATNQGREGQSGRRCCGGGKDALLCVRVSVCPSV